MTRPMATAIAVLISLSLTLVAGTVVMAGGRPFSTDLSGANEVPPADPDGSGTGQLWLNHGQRTVCWQLEVANIAPATAAHIHHAAAGVNGPVVVPLSPPTGGTSSGCVDATRLLITDIMHNPEDYYINVHNAEYPGGAVRGQLSRSSTH